MSSKIINKISCDDIPFPVISKTIYLNNSVPDTFHQFVWFLKMKKIPVWFTVGVVRVEITIGRSVLGVKYD